MSTLSLLLPFTVFANLLPSLPTMPEVGYVDTNVAEWNNFLSTVGALKEIPKDNKKVEFEFLDGSLEPLKIIRFPISDSTGDAAKFNVGFHSKVESKNIPLVSHRADILTNLHVGNQAKWLENVSPSERKTSDELTSEEEQVKGLTRTSKDMIIEGNRKDASTFYLYVPDIKDTLKEKFAKSSMQLGLDIGVATRKDVDKSNALFDSRAKKKRNYIRLCRRLNAGDGATASLIQKLRGKDCVKLPRSEFYLEQGGKDANRKIGTAKIIAMKIVPKTSIRKDYKNFENGSNESKQRGGMMDIVDSSISDGLVNYDGSGIKMTDKLGNLNIKMPIIDGRLGNLLRDGKFRLTASTALKV